MKLRVYRWYGPNIRPVTQHLWLATERNDLCVRAEAQGHEMHVDALREVAPGLWFPAKLTFVEVNNRNHKGTPVVFRRTETVVDEINLAPHHDDAFFRDVAIPADLPIFTIKDRRIVGSMLPEPFDDDWGRKKLAELATRVAEQENRYDNLEVKARTVWSYPHLSGLNQDVRFDQMSEERSIVRGRLAYYKAQSRNASPDGWQDAGIQVHAYDGRWTRRSWTPQNPDAKWAILRKGIVGKDEGLNQAIPVHRAHTMVLHTWWIFSTLADLLASPRTDRDRGVTLRFR